jgi:hypothetical protein
MKHNGTPAALKLIAEEVLVWVKEAAPYWSDDELRRIELCALAVIEWSMFLELYGLKMD